MLAGSLFTRDFLIEGVRSTQAWSNVDEAMVASVRESIAAALDGLAGRKNPNEAETEEDLVYPVLEKLGWHDKDVQPNASVKAREDVPDALLYPDATAKSSAGKLNPWQRFQHGLCVVEAKRWKRALDREDKSRAADRGTPSSQMLRYLRRVDDVTKGRLRWGILTNGCVWRLYFHGALSVAEDFLEIDLGKAFALASSPPDLLDKRPDVFADDDAWRGHVIRLFILLFGRAAFLPAEAGETFHTLALREGLRWEARVARNLSDAVFETAFPVLADALARSDPGRPAILSNAYLEDVKQAALILLYRLLFVLYAEDRDLLPDETGPYAQYCLTRIRIEIADRIAAGERLPDQIATIWPRLGAIFGAIATGSDHLGIPPYNGGLFDPAAAPILGRVQVPDAAIAKVIFGLSHTSDGGERGPKYINYRDLSVQQLGAVYERILEFGLRADDAGAIELDVDDAARHKSGSYYTPEALVALVIERAVGPLVAERVDVFARRARALAEEHRGAEERLADLARADPATALLSLKICDPAMGSGHFLVSLVDWLADKVLDAMAEAPALVGWGTYVSPLAARIADVRERILQQAQLHCWPIVESQLDDRHVVRRMVLKRVVYGVDKNAMAVELAKVALWLHSFTVGAPLSFLDHHLRTGDSVLGAWTHPTAAFLQERGALFNLRGIAAVEKVSGLMTEIEEMTDNDVVEVAASKSKFGAVESVTEPVAALFSLLTAQRMMGVFAAAPKKLPDMRKLVGKPARQVAKAKADAAAFERTAALQLVLEGTFGDPLRIADGRERVAPPDLVAQLALLPEEVPDQSSLFPSISVDDRRRLNADTLVEQARSLGSSENFLHWEIAFPNVWSRLLSSEPPGGFDAVIGNPPYVRQELLGEAAKRALRGAYASFDGAADLYVYFYEQGLRLLRPGGRMSYVVTNKWLKAGYAESLRALFAEKGWLEFVADFGHAKHFFPDADVFPSVLAVRKPMRDEAPPADADICVIPRDAVPRKGLSAVVAEATFPLPRAMFSKEAWVLEPKPVMDLLDKIRRNGVPLAEYAGVKPYRGVLTGLNEAFLIDTAKRDELVRADPKCAEIIKPYLRGQDIERWATTWDHLWMIFLRRGTDIASYPAVRKHLEKFRAKLEPKPIDWQPSSERDKWQGRKEGTYAWFEIQDSTDYWELFSRCKIVYQEIQFHPRYSFDRKACFTNNKAFFITSCDPALLAILNSPLMWWHNWRFLPHMKDEALTPLGVKMEKLPIAGLNTIEGLLAESVESIVHLSVRSYSATTAILDWLRHEFGLTKLGAALSAPHTLDPNGFVAAVRKALPRSRALSAAEIARLKAEYAETLAPARQAASEAMVLERKLSDLVNAAYGLTPEDVALMWATAPPRMPIPPPV